MKAPSYAVLDGIIAATSLYLAGPPDDETDLANVRAADEWARVLRDEKQEKAERRIAGLPPLSHKVPR